MNSNVLVSKVMRKSKELGLVVCHPEPHACNNTVKLNNKTTIEFDRLSRKSMEEEEENGLRKAKIEM